MNIPGFTAEASLYKIRGHYQSITTQGYSSVEQGVVSQIRVGSGGGISIGGGQMGSVGGFWGCLACVAFCSLIIDVQECLVACQDSGACTTTA